MDSLLAMIVMNGGCSLKLSASLSTIYGNTPFDEARAADMTDTPCHVGNPGHIPAQAIVHFAEKNLK